MQAKPESIDFRTGRFTAQQGGGSMTLGEVAAAMSERIDLPADLRGALTGICDETIPDASFPYGCHVCEIEIDADTGTWRIVQHTGVDDVGKAVNPLIIHGQTHGGMAQGIGQALLEQSYLRRRHRAASVRHFHGLCDATRARAAVVHNCD